MEKKISQFDTESAETMSSEIKQRMEILMAMEPVEPVNEETASGFYNVNEQLHQVSAQLEAFAQLGMSFTVNVLYELENFSAGIDVSDYPTSELARKFARVFRVEEDAFRSDYDREKEILHCYIRDAKQYTALRSFAWVLADYANKAGISLSGLSEIEIVAICDLVQDALNRGKAFYQEEPHFPELCGQPDHTIAYIPGGCENPAWAEISVGEYINDERKDCGIEWEAECDFCGDLTGLRNELDQLVPVMTQLHAFLKVNRGDTTAQLEGIAADILYAWCSLAIACNDLVLFTDGPDSYDFEQDFEFDDDEN